MEIYNDIVYIIAEDVDHPEVDNGEPDTDSDTSIYGLENDELDIRIQRASKAQRDFANAQGDGNVLIHQSYNI
jgi:hypothetical protein